MKTILLLFIAYFARFDSLWCLDRSAILQKDIRQFGSGEYRNYEYLSCSWQISWRHCFIDGYSEGTLATCFAGDLFSHNNQSSLVWCLCYSGSHVSNFCQVQRRESGGDQRRHAFRLQSIFFIYSALIFVVCLFITSMVSLTKYDCSLA